MRIALFLFLVIPFISFSQKNCGTLATLDPSACAPLSGCSWTGPNGYVSNECNPQLVICPSNNGAYSFVGDDCDGCPINGTVSVNTCTPTLTINDAFYVGSAQSCFLFAQVTCCDSPSFQWTDPLGNVVSTNGNLGNPVNNVDFGICGDYCLELIDCNGCTDCAVPIVCYNIQNNQSGTPDCCIDPCEDCQGAFIAASNTPSCNTPTVFTLFGCSAPIGLQWFVNGVNQGVSSNSFSWTPTNDGIYSITATFTDDCGNNVVAGPLTYTISGCCTPEVTATNFNNSSSEVCNGSGGFDYTHTMSISANCNTCCSGNTTFFMQGEYQINSGSSTTVPMTPFLVPCGVTSTVSFNFTIDCGDLPAGQNNFITSRIVITNVTNNSCTVVNNTSTLNSSDFLSVGEYDGCCGVDCSACSYSFLISGDQTSSCEDILVLAVPSGCTPGYTYSVTPTGSLTVNTTSIVGGNISIDSSEEPPNVSGTYEFTVTDANGCTGNTSIAYSSCSNIPSPNITSVAGIGVCSNSGSTYSVNWNTGGFFTLPCCYSVQLINTTNNVVIVSGAQSVQTSCFTPQLSATLSFTNLASYWVSGDNDLIIRLTTCDGSVYDSAIAVKVCP